MDRRLWLVVSLPVLLVVAGCMQKTAYRTNAWQPPPAAPCLPDGKGGVLDPCRDVITETTPDYDLHFVEFDDQGWTYPKTASSAEDQSSEQLRLVMERLGVALKAANNKGLRIFVFFHGWKHNAAYNDDNVDHFRDFLKEAALYEDVGQSGNRIVGIYVGWRGKSLDVGEPWLSATFWDRKNAAQHVAVGSVRELTAQLRAFQRHANGTQPGEAKKYASPKDQPVRIYLIGHSFGGLALYAAVAQSLVYGFISGEDIDGKSAPVERLGDMVVLINPAFEATRYKPLDQAARNRDYPVYQAPVLVSITSVADVATGTFFPLGRTLNTLFETEITPEERDANRMTPGHIDAYLTHHVEVTAARTSECAGWRADLTPEHVKANILLEYANSQKFKEQLVDGRWPLGPDGKPTPRVYCGGLVLTPLGGPDGKPDPNMPMWNVTVSADIIPDHSEINLPIFRALLRQLFLDEYFNARAPARALAPSPQLPR